MHLPRAFWTVPYRFLLRLVLRRAERARDRPYDHAASLRIDRIRSALEALRRR